MVKNAVNKWTHAKGKAMFDLEIKYNKKDEYEEGCDFQKWDWKDKSLSVLDDGDLTEHQLSVRKKQNENSEDPPWDFWEFEGHFRFLNPNGRRRRIRFILRANLGSSMMDLHIALPWVNDNELEADRQFSNNLLKLSISDKNRKVILTRYIHIQPCPKSPGYTCKETNRACDYIFASEIIVGGVIYRNFCNVEDIQKICECWKEDDLTKVEGFSFKCELFMELNNQTTSSAFTATKQSVSDSAPIRLKGFKNPFTRSSMHSDVLIKLTGFDEAKNIKIVNSYPAHKYILSSTSPIFARMLESEMKEKISGEIYLNSADVDEVALETFLDLLYDYNRAMHLIKDIQLALGVFQLADKYLVEKLKEFCIQFVIGSCDSSFNLRLALLLFHLGVLYNYECFCFRSTQWFEANKRKVQSLMDKKMLDEFMEQHPKSAGPLLRMILLSFADTCSCY